MYAHNTNCYMTSRNGTFAECNSSVVNLLTLTYILVDTISKSSQKKDNPNFRTMDDG